MSLKTAPFDRPHTTFYSSAIVIIALSCTVFELFDVKWYHDHEIWIRGHSRSFKPVPFESLAAVSYWPSIVTMALSWIICEIKRKSWLFHKFIPLAFDAPVRGSPSEYCHLVWCGKLEWWGYPMMNKLWGYIYKCLDSTPACDRQTDRRLDRQTSCHGIVRAMHTRRAVKIRRQKSPTAPRGTGRL